MKKIFSLSLFSILILTFFFSCPKMGTLGVKLEADKVVCESGETVKFTVILPEKHRFLGGTAKIMNKYGEQVFSTDLAKELTFEYEFKLAGEYQVIAASSSQFNYGYSELGISVTYSGWMPDWSLAGSGNKTSLMGKEGDSDSVNAFDLGYFFESERLELIDHIDVFMYNKKTRIAGKTRLESPSFDYAFKTPHGVGTIDFIVNVYFKDGNAAQVVDKLIILDPLNPVKILVDASKNNAAHPDTVLVKGTIEIVGMSGDIKDILIKRICYYGKEEGVYPLAEPNGNPNDKDDSTFYSKAGVPFVEHEEVYYALKDGAVESESPLKWDESKNLFTFIDPMPYYNEKGEIEKTGFTWDYAKFDREAWKAIKRKKVFDLKKAVAVEYMVSARAEIGGELKNFVDSAKELGVPYLSTKPMVEFCLWTKECAMNRVWHMQVPRYCYTKTLSWLPSAQDIKGDVSGNIFYWVNILSQSGGGGIRAYSDWPSIKISTNADLSISASTKVNVQRDHYVDLTITPDPTVWEPMKFVINNIGVRDYTLQWGLWTDDGVKGKMELTRAGQEKETLEGDDLRFMPTYTASNYTSHPGYGYEEFDWTGANHVSENGATWTKINFLYAPTLGNPKEGKGAWIDHEADWVVRYVTE